MAFDGIGYLDADYVYPYEHHPAATLQGLPLSKALRIAYWYAHNHGRVLISQNYAMNFRDPTGARDRSALVKNSYARIAEGQRYIPDAATHLVGEAIFSILEATNTASAYHRLVTTGGGTDTGSAVEQQIDVSAQDVPNEAAATLGASSLLLRYVALGGYSPYGPRPNTYTARFEVALANVTAGAVRMVYVEAYAADRTSSAAIAYFPQHITVWTEIR